MGKDHSIIDQIRTIYGGRQDPSGISCSVILKFYPFPDDNSRTSLPIDFIFICNANGQERKVPFDFG